MKFFDVIHKRRSIRKFTERMVEPEKIEQLVSTALRAPTARGARSYDFVVVENRELLSAISKARPSGGAFVGGAPLAIVVCADPTKAFPWVEDASIAASHIQLAAQALGLGSCWFHIRDKAYTEDLSSHAYLAEQIGLAENLQVVCVIAIGYADEEKVPYLEKELPFDKIRYIR